MQGPIVVAFFLSQGNIYLRGKEVNGPICDGPFLNFQMPS
jgi:hypothetical protein